MSDTLSLSSVFLACADAGSFAAAGRKLGMSRSSVGKAVVRLETQLGVRLFHRTTRSQSLTEDGALYYEHAHRAVEALESVRQLLEAGRHEPAGVLKVTAPVVFGRRCVAPLLLELVAEHPRLGLEMSFNDRPVDLIEGGFDLGVRIGGPRSEDGLMMRRIGAMSAVWCAAPAYLTRRGTPRSEAEFVDHDLVMYGRLDGERPGRNATGAMRVWLDDLEALAQAARAGLGLARLPCWLAGEEVARGALVQLELDNPRQRFEVVALWPQGPFMPLRLRAALDRLVARLPEVLS